MKKKIISLTLAISLSFVALPLQAAESSTITTKRALLGTAACVCAAITGTSLFLLTPTDYYHCIVQGQTNKGGNTMHRPWSERLTLGTAALGIPAFSIAAALVR